MGEIKLPKRVKLIIGILSAVPELFPVAEKYLQRKFGPIDHKTNLIPFTHTSYYTKSMGEPIKRQFLSFLKLIEPTNIVRIKIWTNQLESSDVKSGFGTADRPINLDPGYLNSAKLVLASTKDYSHRIYLGQGIYAEVTLHYQNPSEPARPSRSDGAPRQTAVGPGSGGRESIRADGAYKPWSWTYPDYQTREYLTFFQTVRQTYLKQTL